VTTHVTLYNMAVRDQTLADANTHAMLAVDSKLILFASPASYLEAAALKLDLQTASEVFADRNYNADGSLVSRSNRNAMLHDPITAADRVVGMLPEGVVRALDGTDVRISAAATCVHGDS